VARAREQAQQELGELDRTRADRLEGLARLAIARTGPVRHVATALGLTAHEAADPARRAGRGARSRSAAAERARGRGSDRGSVDRGGLSALGPTPQLVRIQNPAERLDHATREIVTARMFEIGADAIAAAIG
jgi:hypothetical protein